MGFPLAPNHLLKIIIGGDDDPLLMNRPCQNITIRHSRIVSRYLNDVVTARAQPMSQGPLKPQSSQDLLRQYALYWVHCL